ncbi:hypothetical protein V8F33_000658 [Rhypophila sp. PSN 637]
MSVKILTAFPFLAVLMVHPSRTPPLFPRADACHVPSWSVQGVSVTYSDSTDTPGMASFNITNSVTHQHEALECELLYNTLCRIEGTALDKDLHIYFQVNLRVAVIHFSRSWTCQTTENPSLPSFVDASAEFEVECPEVVTETMTCTGLVKDALQVNGSIVTPIPDSGS